MLTLNQLIAKIQAFATAHKQLKGSFLFELPNIKGSDQARIYPCLTALLASSEPSEQQEVYSILFTVWDLPSDDNHRIQAQEALSDTKLISNDLIAYLKYGIDDILLDVPVTMTPVYDSGEDGCYGWEFTLNLRLNQGLDLCSVPANGVISPPDMNVVSIFDQDGNLLDTLKSGQSYFVTVVSAIDGGSATTIFTNTIIGE